MTSLTIDDIATIALPDRELPSFLRARGAIALLRSLPYTRREEVLHSYDTYLVGSKYFDQTRVASLRDAIVSYYALLAESNSPVASITGIQDSLPAQQIAIYFKEHIAPLADETFQAITEKAKTKMDFNDYDNEIARLRRLEQQ